MYGAGISREGEVIDLGVAANIVDKAGSWFSYSGNRIGQGKDNVREYLKEHPEIAFEIENRVRENFGVVPRPPGSKPAKAAKAAKEVKEGSIAVPAVPADPAPHEDDK
jgi:recombination protein RecA